jgi:hypothetical protein
MRTPYNLPSFYKGQLWFLRLLGLAQISGAGGRSLQLSCRLGGTAPKAKAWTTLARASCRRGKLISLVSLVALTKWSEAGFQLLTATESELVAWNFSATPPARDSTSNESCSSSFRSLCNRPDLVV